MNEKLKRYIAGAIAIAILVAIILGIISALGVFSGAIMLYFGLQYDSIWSIILFFIVATIISYPISMLAEMIPNVLYGEFGKVTLVQARVIYLVLDTVATAIGLVIVDQFMDSISAPFAAIVVASFVLAVLSVWDIGKRREERKTNEY